MAIEFDKNKPKSLLDLVHVENELSKTLKRKWTSESSAA